jgi:signal peptidase I
MRSARVRTASLQAAADLLQRQGGAFAISIRGACMEPVLREGDRILVEPAARLRAGDIVVFQGRRGVLTAHRLLGCTFTPRGLRWMTRPDAPGPIDGLLRRDQILGKVVRNLSQQLEIVPAPWFRAQSAVRLVTHTLRLASRKLARSVSGAAA